MHSICTHYKSFMQLGPDVPFSAGTDKSELCANHFSQCSQEETGKTVLENIALHEYQNIFIDSIFHLFFPIMVLDRL